MTIYHTGRLLSVVGVGKVLLLLVPGTFMSDLAMEVGDIPVKDVTKCLIENVILVSTSRVSTRPHARSLTSVMIVEKLLPVSRV